MEAIFAPSPADQHQSFSPYKHMKNPTKRNNSRGFVPRSTENLVPKNNNIVHGGGGGGLLFAPPPSISFSCPPPFSVLHPYQQIQRQQSLPPLLPLPPSRPLRNSIPPTTRKSNRPRDLSLATKKSKKRDETKPAQSLIISSAVPLGPDPNDLPKDVSKVLSSSPPSSFSSMVGNDVNTTDSIKDMEKLSGSIFTLSPHPSSLPLPKFSMKPKLSCTAEAMGIDDGATDNLRRILRLR